jgi:hypothetical protein
LLKKIDSLEDQVKIIKTVEKERDDLKVKLRKVSDFSSESIEEKAALKRNVEVMVKANKSFQGVIFY